MKSLSEINSYITSKAKLHLSYLDKKLGIIPAKITMFGMECSGEAVKNASGGTELLLSSTFSYILRDIEKYNYCVTHGSPGITIIKDLSNSTKSYFPACCIVRNITGYKNLIKFYSSFSSSVFPPNQQLDVVLMNNVCNINNLIRHIHHIKYKKIYFYDFTSTFSDRTILLTISHIFRNKSIEVIDTKKVHYL